MRKFGKFCLWIALLAPSFIYSGWVFSFNWGLFMVPLGLPDIGIAHALGICGVVAYPLSSPLTQIGIDTKDSDADLHGFRPILIIVVGASFYWLFGWVYSLFM